jgi:glycosyltransferase involved in cell wall biosynthesis
MRLLFLDQFSDPGGAQQVLLELLPAIRLRGWDAVVGMPGAGEMFERVRAAGFPAVEVACGAYRAGAKSWGDSARFAGDALRLSRQVRALAEGADLIYVNGPRLLPGVALAGRLAPVLFHAHSYLPPGKERWLAVQGARRCGASVVAGCEFVAAAWRETAGENRVSVIYNGVAGPDGEPQEGAREHGPTVGCIGRIAPEKGQLDFVRAARVIHTRLPEAQFVIHGASLFGAAEGYEAEVRRAAAGLPLRFAGWTRDIYAALAELDLLLVPSAAQEATTRVILEAFAAGVPVIAYRSGGIPEVVEDGRTGTLVRTAEEMAEAAVQLIGAPARRAEMASGARASWEARFTLRRFHEQLLERIAGAAAAPGTTPRK